MKNKKKVDVEVLDKLSSSEESLEKDDIVIDISPEIDDQSQLTILENLLPDTPTTKDRESDPLKVYLQQISKYKLLSIDEEKALVKQLQETGDIAVAKKLVMANLRLVVKISMEYKNAYKNVLDLIQEGNIGLMKAVSKYDPSKGAKLSYYASWWIKSYILKFILDNFRLVKIGTTAEQKKLFYNLMREKEKLEAQGIKASPKLLSENLGVSEKAVSQMDQRLSSSGAEVSLDNPVKDGSSSTFVDYLPDESTDIESQLSHLQDIEILKDNLQDFIGSLKVRDKDIFKKRLLSEVPPSLQSIADDYGVSRERIRQIEERLIKQLSVYMSEYLS